MEQQPERLRAQGSRSRDCGGPTLGRRAEGERPRRAPALRRSSSRTAYQTAVALLTARDRSRSGLARLLATRGFAPTEIRAAVDHLIEQGYLDDRRFATSWARSRFRSKPMGPLRLRKELEAKGVDERLIQEVLEDVYEQGEEAVARRALAGRAIRRRPLSGASRRGHLARFLQRRGFSTEVIWLLLREEQRPHRGDE